MLQTSSRVRKGFHCPFHCTHAYESCKSLEEHILLHMSKTPLPCPFQSCGSVQPFESEMQLADHIHSTHAEHLGCSLSQMNQDGQLLPLWWIPSRSYPLPDPPPLPKTSNNPLVMVTPYPHFQQPFLSPSSKLKPSSSSSSAAPSSFASLSLHHHHHHIQHHPVRSSAYRPHIPLQIQNMGLQNSLLVAKGNIHFDDLPEQNFSGLLHRSKPPDDWLIWKQPKVWMKSTSRPFHLEKPEDHGLMPPSSMDYNVFSALVDQLKESGDLPGQ